MASGTDDPGTAGEVRDADPAALARVAISGDGTAMHGDGTAVHGDGGHPKVRLDPARGRPDPADQPTVALPRNARRGRAAGVHWAPLPLAALVTTCWAALLSLLPVIITAFAAALIGGGGGGAGTIGRVGLAAWLLAHGVRVGTAAGPVGLVPLAVAALAIWRVGRAGVHTVRALGGRRAGTTRLALGAALAAGLGVGTGYALIGALVAVAADGGPVRIGPLAAATHLLAFGAATGCAGALWEAGLLRRLAGVTPAVLRDGVRTGVVGALLVTGAGAGVAGIALAAAGDDAADMIAAYRTGAAGQAGLVLLCLLYAPNFALWASSYLAGPGFALGTGTTVWAAEVKLGALPAVPVLTALPSRPATWLGVLLLGTPLLAGVVAGWLLARRASRIVPAHQLPWWRLPVAAALAGPVAGLLLAGGAAASGGPLGSGHLSVIGPVWWQVGPAVAGAVSAGAVLAAVATRLVWWAVRARRSPAGRAGRRPPVVGVS